MTNTSITRITFYLKDIQNELNFLETAARESRRAVDLARLQLDSASNELLKGRCFSETLDVNEDRD